MGDFCNDVLQRLQTYLDGECVEDVEAVIEAHLRDCPPCLDRADFERHLKEIIAHKCRDRAPDGLLDRVLGNLPT